MHSTRTGLPEREGRGGENQSSAEVEISVSRTSSGSTSSTRGAGASNSRPRRALASAVDLSGLGTSSSRADEVCDDSTVGGNLENSGVGAGRGGRQRPRGGEADGRGASVVDSGDKLSENGDVDVPDSQNSAANDAETQSEFHMAGAPKGDPRGSSFASSFKSRGGASNSPVSSGRDYSAASELAASAAGAACTREVREGGGSTSPTDDVAGWGRGSPELDFPLGGFGSSGAASKRGLRSQDIGGGEREREDKSKRKKKKEKGQKAGGRGSELGGAQVRHGWGYAVAVAAAIAQLQFLFALPLLLLLLFPFLIAIPIPHTIALALALASLKRQHSTMECCGVCARELLLTHVTSLPNSSQHGALDDDQTQIQAWAGSHSSSPKGNDGGDPRGAAAVGGSGKAEANPRRDSERERGSGAGNGGREHGWAASGEGTRPGRGLGSGTRAGQGDGLRQEEEGRVDGAVGGKEGGVGGGVMRDIAKAAGQPQAKVGLSEGGREAEMRPRLSLGRQALLLMLCDTCLVYGCAGLG